MDKFTEAYNNLNLEQKQAVEAIEGSVMVIAGPGTGKTQTLALRIANILKKTQIDPQNILCLTFTENGTVAMLNRLNDFIGPAAYKVKIHTFHSFCQSVIINNFEKFPQLNEDNENIDDTDKYLIIQDILASLPLKDPLRNISNIGLYIKEIISSISDLKKEGVSPERLEILIEKEKLFYEEIGPYLLEFLSLRSTSIKEEHLKGLLKKLSTYDGGLRIYAKGVEEIIEEYGGVKMTPIKSAIKRLFRHITSESYFEKLTSLKNIYEKYQKELLKRGSYDYDDMIMFVLEKLNNDEEFLNEIQELYQYILIDEYQDTNSAQNELIELIGSYFENPNIFVVGDDDQSIFRFQGASLENILYFHKKYPEQRTITLKNNYRSQPNILKASREIITHSENRLEDEIKGIDKNLNAMKSSPSTKVVITESTDIQSEAFYVANEIKKLLKDNDASEIAVILTTNIQMGIYEEVFNKFSIKYQVSKSENTLDSKHVKNILTLIHYIEKQNEELLAKILYFDYWDFDILNVSILLRYSSDTRTSLFKIMSSSSILKNSGIENYQPFLDLAKTLSNLQMLMKTEDPATFFTVLLKDCGIIDRILAETDNYQQLVKVNKLFDFLKRQLSKNRNLDYKDFLDRIDLVKEYHLNIFSETPIGSESSVNILTAHKSKGLEFKYVFIPNLTEKNWEKKKISKRLNLPPSINKQDIASNDFDEKVRLFYVAMTRAKEGLYLSYPKYDDNGRENKKSMFVSLIGEDISSKNTYLPEQIEKINQLSLQLQPSIQSEFSNKGKDYLNTLLENYMLSPTDFNNYRTCPHCFFLNKLIRLPQVMTPQQSYGSAIHKSLQDYLNKYRRVEKLPGFEYLVESYKLALSKQILNEKDYEDFLTHGESQLKNFYQSKLTDLAITSVPELNFKQFKIRVNDVPITGKIDRIDFKDSLTGVAQVVDYKTGKYTSKSLSVKGRGDYYVQLLFYKLLIDNYQKYNWKINEGKIVYIESDSQGNLQEDKVLALKDEDIEWLKQEIKVVYDAIINLEFKKKKEKGCYTEHLHDINFVF